MYKNFAQKVFCRWLRANGRRFKHAPVFIRVRRGYFIFKFSGIAPEIICRISRHGMIEVYAYHQGTVFDILADFDLIEIRRPNGQYCCGLCPESELFSSRKTLWQDHGLEPLLAWANENLLDTNRLYLFKIAGYGSWAYLKPSGHIDNMSSESEYLLQALPLVR